MQITKEQPQSTIPQQPVPILPQNALLSQITPTNLSQQKALFFKNNCKIDPIFTYNRTFSESKTIVDVLHYEEALRILRHPHAINNKKQYLSKEETIQQFNQYIQELGIQKQVQISFDKNTVSRTKVKHFDNYSLVIIRDPPSYTKNCMKGVMDHEIGTHIVRKINDRKQNYYKHRKKHGISPCKIDIQEGLAVLNQLLQQQSPLLFIPAIRYISSILASKSSFCFVYQQLLRYMKDQNQAWNQTVRAKRSLTNTSERGGFYKDQAYFIGALIILEKRKQIDFVKLHGGKINIQDIEHINSDVIVKPKFLDHEYLEKLNKIAIFNGLQ